jgi:hypothetical protein
LESSNQKGSYRAIAWPELFHFMQVLRQDDSAFVCARKQPPSVKHNHKVQTDKQLIHPNKNCHLWTYQIKSGEHRHMDLSDHIRHQACELIKYTKPMNSETPTLKDLKKRDI